MKNPHRRGPAECGGAADGAERGQPAGLRLRDGRRPGGVHPRLLLGDGLLDDAIRARPL